MSSPPKSLEPVTLEGRYVRLEPLAEAHFEGLCACGLHRDLWRYTPVVIETREAMRDFVDWTLEEQERGAALAFATIDRASRQIAGTTRFHAIDLANRRVEIGWTFVGKRWQRTAINSEAKLLMFTQAFEEWSLVRVELKTHAENRASRAAILRLGASEEGILRKHMQYPGGRVRDTVYHSIVDDEWPEKKAALEAKTYRDH